MERIERSRPPGVLSMDDEGLRALGLGALDRAARARRTVTGVMAPSSSISDTGRGRGARPRRQGEQHGRAQAPA